MTRRALFAVIISASSVLFGYGRQTSAPKPTTPQDPRGVTIRQVASGMAPDGKGQLWAVIVGISNYKNVPPEGQLRFAHRDAEDLAAFLRSPSGGGFPSNHIKLLLNQDATSFRYSHRDRHLACQKRRTRGCYLHILRWTRSH